MKFIVIGKNAEGELITPLAVNATSEIEARKMAKRRGIEVTEIQPAIETTATRVADPDSTIIPPPAAPLPSPEGLFEGRSYPILTFIAVLFFFSGVTGILGTASYLFYLSQQSTSSLSEGLCALAIGASSCLVAFGIGEVLMLAINIARDVREAKDALVKRHESQK